MGDARVGAFPGTFAPLTIAHLALADAAVEQLTLTRLELVVSIDPIGKATVDAVELEARLEAIRVRATAARPWLSAVTTELRLVSDIAAGYDVCILGADKWEQVLDPIHYGSPVARDAALARLPTIAVAPRTGSAVPDPPVPVDLVILDVPADVGGVSSSAVRAGRTDWQA